MGANSGKFEKRKEEYRMYESLRKLMEPELNESRAEGISSEKHSTVERMTRLGMAADVIAKSAT